MLARFLLFALGALLFGFFTRGVTVYDLQNHMLRRIVPTREDPVNSPMNVLLVLLQIVAPREDLVAASMIALPGCM